MPSIAGSFNPYEAHVVEAPVMGSFADMWGVRQESDIVFEDGVTKNKRPANADDIEQQPPAPVEHTFRVHLHNPYSLTEPLTEVYCCGCYECQKQQNNTTTTTTIAQREDASHVASLFVHEEEPEEVFEFSRFMPPAPPRLDTYDVITACGAVDPDTIVYTMMMRWFSKVSRVQSFFAPETECPAPCPSEYNFAEWCSMVNDWWIKNFEHRQKKVQPIPQTTTTHHHHRYQHGNHHW